MYNSLPTADDLALPGEENLKKRKANKHDSEEGENSNTETVTNKKAKVDATSAKVNTTSEFYSCLFAHSLHTID